MWLDQSNDETNFPHNLLWTNTRVSEICKVFRKSANGSSANTKISRTHFSRMIQSGEFNIFDVMNSVELVYKIASKANNLSNKMSQDKIDEVIKTADVFRTVMLDFNKILGTGITLKNNEIKNIIEVIRSLENRRIFLKGATRKITSQEGGFLNFLKSLMSFGLPLMKNVLTPLAKIVLAPWRLTTTASAINTAIQKKIYGSGTTALVFSNEDLNDIMKIIKSLGISHFLIKGVSETVENEAKKTKRWISWYLLGIWGASFLRNILACKMRVVRSSKRWRCCY